jgi:uncharacterized protein YkwD
MRASSNSLRSSLVATCLALASTLAACTSDDSGPEPSGPDGGSVDPPGADGGSVDPPPGGYCGAVADWPASASALEREVLELVNQRRSQGADCGSEGSFGPAGPLAQNAQLDCAARVHTLDMHERDYFEHTNPDGEAPWDRMERAGYSYSQAGENIAFGPTTAAAVIEQWMESDGHCANIMSPGFVHIGIGHHAESRLWTQVFGAPL